MREWFLNLRDEMISENNGIVLYRGLQAPPPRDIVRVIEYSAFALAIEALRQINAEWCPHPDVTIERMQKCGRDWCGACHSWVRLGETNPADQALAKLDSKPESLEKKTKWQVEYIADQANILIVDKSKHLSEWEPVGLGLPHGLAERIVKMHNEALEPGQAK